MSTLTSTRSYDETFDAQKHYRTLLDCTARPGTIGQLDDVPIEIPRSYNRATVFLGVALLSTDTTYCLVPRQGQTIEAEHEFLQSRTGAKTSVIEKADFVILMDPEQLSETNVRLGTPSYPETGATVIVQVEGISPAPMPDSLRLRLTGPGIETETIVFVTGASPAFFEARHGLNVEFPIGFDLFVTCDSLSAGPCVLALPRTTRVDWERI